MHFDPTSIGNWIAIGAWLYNAFGHGRWKNTLQVLQTIQAQQLQQQQQIVSIAQATPVPATAPKDANA